MRAGPRERGEVLPWLPLGTRGHGGVDRGVREPEQVLLDAVAGDGVPDRPGGGQPCGIDSKPCRERGARVFARVALDGGELPQAAVDRALGTTQDKPASGALPKHGGHGPVGDGRARGGAWEVGRAPRFAGAASFGDGACLAMGRRRGAGRGAEFHERLVERGARAREPDERRMGQGVGRVHVGRGSHEPAGGAPERIAEGPLPGVSRQGEEAREHAHDVAVEDGGGVIEGDGDDGAGRVAADAGQGEPAFEVGGQGSVARLDDLTRGRVEVPGATVVAKALPELEDLVRRRMGEGPDVRELGHPASPVGNDGRDLRLLEHGLRDPDRVGVQRATPREVPCGASEPFHEDRGDVGSPGNGRLARRDAGHGVAGGYLRHQLFDGPCCAASGGAAT